MVARRSLMVRLVALALLALGCRREPAITLRVAVSADLAPAFEALGGEFTRSDAVGVTYDFSAPATVAAQITEGNAPRFDVFITTDTSYVGRLVSIGRCEDISRTFAGFATLVLVTAPSISRIDAVQNIAEARFARIAILHPERNAFGRASMQVFNSLGLYETLSPRLVYEDTARAVLDRVRSGSVQAALVPRAIVTEGDSLAIPVDLYRPIEQVAVSCTRDSLRREAATRMLQYLHEGEGKALLESYGFEFR
jgi:molybdate transport system substrate-binding protein